MKNLDDGIYGKLTPAERVALVVEAIARKDLSEADRLIDTCEIKTYTMRDAAYSERLRAIHTAALHALLMLEHQHAATLAMLGPLLFYADKNDRKSKEGFADAAEKLRVLDSHTRGVWFAWEEFCADAGVDPVKTLEVAWGPVPDYYRHGSAKVLIGMECEPAEPEPEEYKRALNLFSQGLDTLQKRYGGRLAA